MYLSTYKHVKSPTHHVMSTHVIQCHVMLGHAMSPITHIHAGNIISTYSTDATQDSPRQVSKSWQYDSEQMAQNEFNQMVQIGSDFWTGKAFQSNSGRTIQAESNMMAQNGSKSSTPCNIDPTHLTKDFSEV